MKTKPTMDSEAAFPDPKLRPDEVEFERSLGRPFDPIGKVFERLSALHADVTTAWQFSERSGWYLIVMQKKRRLLYLVPKRRDFRLMMILGGKALAELKAGPFARQATELLKFAKRYPEGTAFTFDRKSCDPDLISAFLAAKISH